MRTLSDLQAAFDALECQADAYADGERSETVVEPRSWTAPRFTEHLGAGETLTLAAAVVVAAAAAGSAYVWSGSGIGRNGAAGGATPMCIAPLPPSWKQALSAHQFGPVQPVGTGDGIATPLSVTADGQVLFWETAESKLIVSSFSAARGTRTVATLPVPTGQQVTRVAVDAHSVVAEFWPPIKDGSQRINVDDIVLINRSTGAIKHLLSGAPIPTGDVESAGGGIWATLQDGVYYWLEGAPTDNAPQTLMSYDIATGTYGVQDTGQAAVYLNALGVSWNGGSVPVQGVPPVHPPVDLVKQSIVYDGTSLAWAIYDDPSTVYWSDQSGASRTVSQDLMSQLEVHAVSGPYVFLTYGEGSDSDKVNADLQILDTRTGALADTGIQGVIAAASGDGIAAISSDESAGFSMRVIDVKGLPRLSCGPS